MIPAAALNQHIAILGKTGSGKTYAAKGVVEQLLSENRHVCILDPTSAWWGLRLLSSGKQAGFDVVILGGDHGDLPLAERSGPAVARLVTEQGASVVVDTGAMHVGEYTRWFIGFASTLYTTIRAPLHLVIDEAHYFMPQGKVPDPDTGKMLHAGNRLMSGGRSRGIRGMLITQRPAKLHKDALTCADIAGRIVGADGIQAIVARRVYREAEGQAARGTAFAWVGVGISDIILRMFSVGRLKDKRMPKIGERRLFGPHTCRIGGCGRDGTVGVDLPGIQWHPRRTPDGQLYDYEEVPTWTRIYYCERHAAKELRDG